MNGYIGNPERTVVREISAVPPPNGYVFTVPTRGAEVTEILRVIDVWQDPSTGMWLANTTYQETANTRVPDEWYANRRK